MPVGGWGGLVELNRKRGGVGRGYGTRGEGLRIAPLFRDPSTGREWRPSRVEERKGYHRHSTRPTAPSNAMVSETFT